MRNGYLKDQNVCITQLDKEIHLNAYYYQIDETVKKLSFVFVVCSVDNYGDQYLKNKKNIENSRGSLTKERLFKYLNSRAKKNVHHYVIPAYIVIFKIE